MSEIKVEIATDNKELIIREGDAAIIQEPEAIIIVGVLDTPLNGLLSA